MTTLNSLFRLLIVLAMVVVGCSDSDELNVSLVTTPNPVITPAQTF